MNVACGQAYSHYEPPSNQETFSIPSLVPCPHPHSRPTTRSVCGIIRPLAVMPSSMSVILLKIKNQTREPIFLAKLHGKFIRS